MPTGGVGTVAGDAEEPASGDVEVGVGVGPTATITGLADGDVLAGTNGTPDGPCDPTDGDCAAVAPGDSADPLAAGPIDGCGVALAAAMSRGGTFGATTPAVSATVARMRFRRPIATTRRARCAVVTAVMGSLVARWESGSRTARW